MDLLSYINEFRNTTIEIISCLENEEFDCIELLTLKREELVVRMKQLNYSKDEFISLCNDFNILELDEKLTKISGEKKQKLRREIDKLQITRDANKKYNKNFSVDSIFFNKKI